MQNGDSVIVGLSGFYLGIGKVGDGGIAQPFVGTIPAGFGAPDTVFRSAIYGRPVYMDTGNHIDDLVGIRSADNDGFKGNSVGSGVSLQGGSGPAAEDQGAVFLEDTGTEGDIGIIAGDADHIVTVVEGILVHQFHTVLQSDGGQTGAVFEGPAVNGAQGVGEIQGGQTGAVLEGLVINGERLSGPGDIGQSGAETKGTVGDFGGRSQTHSCELLAGGKASLRNCGDAFAKCSPGQFKTVAESTVAEGGYAVRNRDAVQAGIIEGAGVDGGQCGRQRNGFQASAFVKSIASDGLNGTQIDFTQRGASLESGIFRVAHILAQCNGGQIGAVLEHIGTDIFGVKRNFFQTGTSHKHTGTDIA